MKGLGICKNARNNKQKTNQNKPFFILSHLLVSQTPTLQPYPPSSYRHTCIMSAIIAIILTIPLCLANRSPLIRSIELTIPKYGKGIKRETSFADSIIAGTIGRLTAQTLLYPLDVLRTKKQLAKRFQNINLPRNMYLKGAIPQVSASFMVCHIPL